MEKVISKFVSVTESSRTKIKISQYDKNYIIEFECNDVVIRRIFNDKEKAENLYKLLITIELNIVGEE